MSGSRKRGEPRHVDADKLRISFPTGRFAVGALVLVVVLAIAGVAFASGGLLPGSGTNAVAGSASDPKPLKSPSSPSVTEEPPAEPTAYKVVAATRILPAPDEKPERPKRGNNSLAERAERAATPTISEFGVAMINILGSQHTAGGRGGFAPGTSRAYTATQMLLARGSSIIGFSEIQNDQLAVFRNNAPAYDVYPGTELGNAGVPASVAWDTAVWRLVETQSVSISFSGQIRPQPVVKLANVASGVEIWVMNVHNSPEGMEGERDRAEAIELAKINELTADGTPMVVLGDFNEKQEILCRVTATTVLESTIGGGSCYPPPQPMRVDWIFASPSFTFGSYEVTRAAPVPYITDHAVLFSRLSLG
ncbi:MAG: endonuclease/exonuclease/phosphatase family protein [Nocardioides sp.]